MTDRARSRALVEGYRDRPDASTRRLTVTVFGDAIGPRGGSIWLGELIELLAAFGVNERLVRTSVQRLVAEGVLRNERVGRRSRYALTDAARIDARDAERRIYHGVGSEWDGRWTVVAVLPSDDPLPHDLGARLGWRGFGELRPGVHASPVIDAADAHRVLAELDVAERLVVMTSTADDDRRLADACFELVTLRRAYAELVERYEPVAEELGRTSTDDRLAFALRTLLVDDFRRVVLRDPELPAPLLPDDWTGHQARAVAGRVYRAVREGADRHLSAVSAEAGAPLPPPGERVGLRFS
ncbi:MAG: PaaX family transcriptional regulator C-terminal domain-containing protein [Actinomycetota bacterium]